MKLSIAVTEDMAAELRAAVEGGDYGSVSEVVRDALRDWRLRPQGRGTGGRRTSSLAREGIDSGPSDRWRDGVRAICGRSTGAPDRA